MTDDIYCCGYYCMRPECILKQRNELRDLRFAAPQTAVVRAITQPAPTVAVGPMMFQYIQYRVLAVKENGSDWSDWSDWWPCSEYAASGFERMPIQGGWKYEVRRFYAAPNQPEPTLVAPHTAPAVSIDSVNQAILLCQWIAETPHQRGSINGLAAQVLHGLSRISLPDQPKPAAAAEPSQPATRTKALTDAAQAVLNRWDSPQWDWGTQGPTADLMSALREALASCDAPAVAVSDAWQPIKTAPKDGRLILVGDLFMSDEGKLEQTLALAKWYSCFEWSGWIYDDDALQYERPEGPTASFWFDVPPIPKEKS